MDKNHGPAVAGLAVADRRPAHFDRTFFIKLFAIAIALLALWGIYIHTVCMYTTFGDRFQPGPAR